MNRGGHRSVEGVFQPLARLEARHLGGGYLYGRTGLRVAAFTRGTLLHLEGAEAHQGDVLPLLEGAGDGGRESVQGGGRRALRQVSGCRDGGDQFGFVHASIQVEEWPPSITSEGHQRPDQLPEPGSGAYTELCKLGVMSRAVVARALQRLEKAGLIKRETRALKSGSLIHIENWSDAYGWGKIPKLWLYDGNHGRMLLLSEFNFTQLSFHAMKIYMAILAFRDRRGIATISYDRPGGLHWRTQATHRRCGHAAV